MAGAQTGLAVTVDQRPEPMRLAADDVQSLVIPGIGHWLAEQAPDQMEAALTAFLAPYRDASSRVTAKAAT